MTISLVLFAGQATSIGEPVNTPRISLHFAGTNDIFTKKPTVNFTGEGTTAFDPEALLREALGRGLGLGLTEEEIIQMVGNSKVFGSASERTAMDTLRSIHSATGPDRPWVANSILIPTETANPAFEAHLAELAGLGLIRVRNIRRGSAVVVIEEKDDAVNFWLQTKAAKTDQQPALLCEVGITPKGEALVDIEYTSGMAAEKKHRGNSQ